MVCLNNIKFLSVMKKLFEFFLTFVVLLMLILFWLSFNYFTLFIFPIFLLIYLVEFKIKLFLLVFFWFCIKYVLILNLIFIYGSVLLEAYKNGIINFLINYFCSLYITLISILTRVVLQLVFWCNFLSLFSSCIFLMCEVRILCLRNIGGEQINWLFRAQYLNLFHRRKLAKCFQ